MNPWNPWNRWIMNMKAMKRVRHILNLQHFKNIQVCIESFHMTIPHLILLPYDPMRNCEVCYRHSPMKDAKHPQSDALWEVSLASLVSAL